MLKEMFYQEGKQEKKTLDWSQSQYNCIIRMAIVVWVI